MNFINYTPLISLILFWSKDITNTYLSFKWNNRRKIHNHETNFYVRSVFFCGYMFFFLKKYMFSIRKTYQHISLRY